MTPGFDIVGFGSLAIDDIAYVNQPLTAGKGKIIARQTQFGGNVATALVAAAHLGARVGYIGTLGLSGASARIDADFEAHGVDVSKAHRVPEAVPIQAIVIVDPTGERFIAFDDDIRPSAPDNFDPARFCGAKVMLMDGYAAWSLPAIRIAKAQGLQLVADFEWTAPTGMDELMALADHLVLPFDFAVRWTGQSEPAAIIAALWSDTRRAVVLTCGASGSFYTDGANAGKVWHQPALAVEVVDTTGCGDCFHGAYAVALAGGMAMCERIRFATVAAAIAATGKTGRGALASRADIARVLDGGSLSAAEPV